MEKKIMEILRRMQGVLQEKQQKELQNVLMIVLAGCKIVEETSVKAVSNEWMTDLQDFLMSKSLGGKSPETVKRYQYELQRLYTAASSVGYGIGTESD